jgi:hypothetical protein
MTEICWLQTCHLLVSLFALCKPNVMFIVDMAIGDNLWSQQQTLYNTKFAVA